MRCFFSSLTLLWLFLLGACKTSSFPANDSATLKIGGIALYHSLGYPGKPARKELKRLGIQEATVIDGRYLHSDDGLRYTPEKLAAALKHLVPRSRADHLIILDWEGTRMEQIFEGALKESETYLEAKGQLLGAYRLTKALFPGYTVGFYGFPIRDYWGRDQNWRERNTALADFLNETDALFPSLYDFYQTTKKNRPMEASYIRENIEEALRLGHMLNKPVYPFIWHRYHPSNQKLGLQPVPIKEFAEHLRIISETRYKNKRIDGLVWWSAENYFFRTGQTEDYDAFYFDDRNGRLIIDYLEALVNAARLPASDSDGS